MHYRCKFKRIKYNKEILMKRISISAFIVGFLLISAVGVAYSGMMMGHGDMVGCPLMGNNAAVCNMNPLEHFSAWQNLFAAIPVQSTVISLLLLLAVFFLFRLHQFLWLLHPSPQRVYVHIKPEVSTYDPLRRFMARGLMHPKIF